MIGESQIRKELGRYLRRDLSLERFEDWLAQNSWNMHKDSSEEAQKVVAAIELRLAEHSSGHLNEPALRDELRQFVNPLVVLISFGNARQAPMAEPSNNVLVKANAQVVGFISHPVVRPPEPYLGGVVSADKEQLVVFA